MFLKFEHEPRVLIKGVLSMACCWYDLKEDLSKAKMHALKYSKLLGCFTCRNNSKPIMLTINLWSHRISNYVLRTARLISDNYNSWNSSTEFRQKFFGGVWQILRCSLLFLITQRFSQKFPFINPLNICLVALIYLNTRVLLKILIRSI